jgi:hypothetical protein
MYLTLIDPETGTTARVPEMGEQHSARLRIFRAQAQRYLSQLHGRRAGDTIEELVEDDQPELAAWARQHREGEWQVQLSLRAEAADEWASRATPTG